MNATAAAIDRGSMVPLSIWDCGHVELDQGRTHVCDGRDVCSAEVRYFAPAAAAMLHEFHTHRNALEETNHPGLRETLIREETDELLEALMFAQAPLADDASREIALKALARECADVLYVVYGTAWVFGIDLDAALGEIHRAAMDKMRAGLRRDDGKIMKPPGFVPPDMTAAVAGGAA